MLVLLNINGIAKLTVICDSPNWLAFIVDHLYNAKLFRNNGTTPTVKNTQIKVHLFTFQVCMQQKSQVNRNNS